jgi:catechol 2,3-dioxygenase-like lactoylglutathione lyase family enzyme
MLCRNRSEASTDVDRSRGRLAGKAFRLSRGFPDDKAELTHILVVDESATSRRWYEEVLGAEVQSEYGTSVVLRFRGAWLLLVEGGDPTEDKPTVTLAPPSDPDTRDNLFTIRVSDCHAVYEELRSRGATFLTAPMSHGPETRCFFRDPDGHLFEISEYRPD